MTRVTGSAPRADYLHSYWGSLAEDEEIRHSRSSSRRSQNQRPRHTTGLAHVETPNAARHPGAEHFGGGLRISQGRGLDPRALTADAEWSLFKVGWQRQGNCRGLGLGSHKEPSFSGDLRPQYGFLKRNL